MNPPIDITGVELTTPRLLLRPFNQEDLDDFYEYASIPGVGEMAGWNHHESKEESQRILSMFIAEKKCFAIVYEGKVIGSLGLEKYREQEFPQLIAPKGREIGYVLSKAYWGKGLMTEAVKEVLRYCFEDLGLDFMVCQFALANPASGRVQEKAGFRYSHITEYTCRNGEVRTSKVNLLTKEEYFASK